VVIDWRNAAAGEPGSISPRPWYGGQRRPAQVASPMRRRFMLGLREALPTRLRGQLNAVRTRLADGNVTAS